MYGFEAMTFNIQEDIGGVRGHDVLSSPDYNKLCKCETLDDIKMHLSSTEYGPYLQNGEGAMLWDVRKNLGTMKVQPVAKLDGRTGPVMHLYTDSYMIITGFPDDACVGVWDAGTDGEFGVVQLRDFNYASEEFLLCTDDECEGASKFWESGSLADDNSI